MPSDLISVEESSLSHASPFATVVLATWEALRAALLTIKRAQAPVFTNRYARVVYTSKMGLIALVVTILFNQPAPDIVYKAF